MYNYFVCQSLRGKLEEQKISELPFNRLHREPPLFAFCGVNLFGPFVICSKQSFRGRKYNIQPRRPYNGSNFDEKVKRNLEIAETL